MLFSHFSILQYPPGHFPPSCAFLPNPASPNNLDTMTRTGTFSEEGKASCMVVLWTDLLGSVSPDPCTLLTGQGHR